MDSSRIPQQWKHTTEVPIPTETLVKVMNNLMACGSHLTRDVGHAEGNKESYNQGDQTFYGPSSVLVKGFDQVYYMDKVHKHLELPNTKARLLFADSDFNTLQLQILADKLSASFNLDTLLTSWITEFLTNRKENRTEKEEQTPQYCHFLCGRNISDILISPNIHPST